MLSNLTLLVFLYFVKYYEIPGQTQWNPFGSYTPSYNNPRAAYQLVNTNDFMMGFDIITMFQSVRFRERFTQGEVE
jgi:hypothetical protein